MLGARPVKDFMTQAVLSIDLRTPAGEVLRHFTQYPVHHLPVVDNARVVGMLSSADVMKLEMFLPKSGKGALEYLNGRVTIEQLMRRPALTIRGDQSLESAARVMAEFGIHALPVADHDDHLIGIITTTDIMDAALRPGHDAPNHPHDEADTHSASAADLEGAMVLAATLVSADGERGRLARVLMALAERVRRLEHVRICAERYLHAGQDSQRHAELLAALHQTSSDPDRNSWLI